MAKINRFTVHGFGEFPWDMLRYDACWPATEGDSALMEAHHRERRSITLQTDSDSAPTIGRWNSFLWPVADG